MAAQSMAKVFLQASTNKIVFRDPVKRCLWCTSTFKLIPGQLCCWRRCACVKVKQAISSVLERHATSRTHEICKKHGQHRFQSCCTVTHLRVSVSPRDPVTCKSKGGFKKNDSICQVEAFTLDSAVQPRRTLPCMSPQEHVASDRLKCA